jgi:hypothetical protein
MAFFYNFVANTDFNLFICYTDFESYLEGFIMKKIIYILVIFSVLILSACDGNVQTDQTTLMTTEEISDITSHVTTEAKTSVITEVTTHLTTDIPTDITSELTTIIPTVATTEETEVTTEQIETTTIDIGVVFDQSLTIEDQALLYDFSETELDVYTIESNPGIFYVDVEMLLAALDEGIIDFELAYDSGSLILSYAVDDLNPITITIDSETERIEYSDFNIFANMNEAYDESYEYNVVNENIDYIQGDLSGFIDLKTYDMTIEEKDGHIYMPMYLANLFFTGLNFEIYHYDDRLFIFDNQMSYVEMFMTETIDDEIVEENIVKNTVNYMALLFDYFYGLKDYYGIDSYVDEFDDFGFYNQTTFEDFNELMQKYIYANGDLHTNIFAYGYDADKTETVIPFTYDKIYKYQQTFMIEDCSIREDEVTLEIEEDYYVLSINAFTLNTSDLLAELLVDIDPEKDIYIDLACNGGGTLVSVFETLAYLTNDPIELSYMNQQTGEIFTDLYTPKEDLALDNQFYVYINHSTFSAANLFVEIVKDNKLAFVFGNQSFGGGSSVVMGVLPNHMWITYSSNMLLLNQDLEMIESGATPHYQLERYVYFDGGQEEVSSLYSSLYGVYVNSLSTVNYVDLNVTTTKDDEDIDFVKYVVEYLDYETGDILYATEHFDKDLILSEQTGISDGVAVIRVQVHYSYLGYNLIQIIYKDVVDLHSNIFNMNTSGVGIDSLTTLNKYASGDVDFIKIVIEETGTYRIRINDEFLGLQHLFYNSDGMELFSSEEALLSPGTYLIDLDISDVDVGDYTVFIEYIPNELN